MIPKSNVLFSGFAHYFKLNHEMQIDNGARQPMSVERSRVCSVNRINM